MVIIFGEVVGSVFKSLPDVVMRAPATGNPGITGVKDVVVKDIIPAGVDLHTAKNPPGAMGEDITVDDLATDGIIQAKARLTPDEVFVAGSADMMEVVVPEGIAAVGRVAPHIHSALVVGFGDRVVGLVELDEMVVASDPHDTAGAVMHQVVGNPVAHPHQQDGRGVSAVNTAEVVEVAVFNKMPARGQGFPVPAIDLGGTAPDSMDLTTEDAVGAAAVNDHAPAGDAPDNTTRQEDIPAVVDLDPVPAGQVKNHPLKAQVGKVFHQHQRFGEHADFDYSRFRVRRRIEVKDAAGRSEEHT